jgi:glyoxylase-like metal-dependent hydrolase (beta-lactamase superfamily II)
MGCGAIAEAFGAPVVCHEREREHVAKKCGVAETFSDRHTIDGDFEAIPIPGHTEGATAYLWSNGGQRCLFTGDSVYLHDGDWRAAVLESSDRTSYIASLELLGGLEFDLLVPWAASIGQPLHARTDKADAQRRIELILGRLRRGGDH